MTTFSEVLTRQLRADAGRPFVTFYDDATGERVELSVTTYANWVAKTASLLAEEHDLERGQTLCVDLPTHWLGPVFLGAAWTVGLVVTGPDDAGHDPDAVVCGPDGLDRWAGTPTTSRCWPARCCRSASASPTRCRPASTTSASRSGRSRTRSPRGTRRARTTWPPAVVRRRDPGRALASGRRRESPHRRRPPPVGGEPGFPTGTRHLHRAARQRRLAGPGHPRRTGASRGDVSTAERVTARFP